MKVNQTILVVDDEDTIREVIRRYLEREGFEVKEAADGFDALSIVWDSYGTESDILKAQEAASIIAQRADDFGINNIFVEPVHDYLNNSLGIRNRDLVVFVGANYSSNTANGEPIEVIDHKLPFLINCPAKRDMSDHWNEYLNTLSRLEHTISVGVGNYDNAIILAAQLSHDPIILGKVWQYRNGKTNSGVVRKPTWLRMEAR